MGDADPTPPYVTLCAQLRLPRSLSVGDRYATQHPFDGSLGEVKVKTGGDGPAATGSTTIWIPRLGDLFDHHARELSLERRGETKAWYRRPSCGGWLIRASDIQMPWLKRQLHG